MWLTAQNAFNWYLGVLRCACFAAPAVGTIEFWAYTFFLSSFVIFLASFIILSYLTYHINMESGQFATFIEKEHIRGLIGQAVWILPKKVRVNDTYVTSLDVTFCKTDDSNKSSDCLEGGIQAIGLDVRSMGRLKICKTSPLPTITWVHSFIKSGINTINLTINVVKPTDNSNDFVFMHKHTVKVDSFLRASSAPAFALIVPTMVRLSCSGCNAHAPMLNTYAIWVLRFIPYDNQARLSLLQHVVK